MRRQHGAIWGLACLLGVWGCNQQEAVPEGHAAEVAGPSGRVYRSDWQRLEAGSEPSEFVDVRQDGHRWPWLYGGDWRIAHGAWGTVYEVPRALRSPPEPLTFRRYRGEAFGPNGALPRRFRLEAEGRSLGGSTRFGGYGELAVQVHYLSPTTYVEVLQTDTALVIWEARNAAPMQGKGWTELARVPHRAPLGAWVRFGAEVDRDEGTITALLDGKAVARAQTALLHGPAAGAFTLRATGNREEWKRVEVRELSGSAGGSAARPE